MKKRAKSKNNDGLAFPEKRKREKVLVCCKWQVEAVQKIIYLSGVFTNKRGNTISLTQQGIQTERNRKIKIAI